MTDPMWTYMKTREYWRSRQGCEGGWARREANAKAKKQGNEAPRLHGASRLGMGVAWMSSMMRAHVSHQTSSVACCCASLLDQHSPLKTSTMPSILHKHTMQKQTRHHAPHLKHARPMIPLQMRRQTWNSVSRLSSQGCMHEGDVHGVNKPMQRACTFRHGRSKDGKTSHLLNGQSSALHTRLFTRPRRY